MGRIGESVSDDPWDVRLATAGAGVKFFVAKQSAIRVEYRFLMATHEHSILSSGYSYTAKQTWYMNDLLLGVSVFL